MKLVAAAAALLVVAGGAGGYMFINCPSRCGGETDAVTIDAPSSCCPLSGETQAATPVAATPVAAVPVAATPVAATPAVAGETCPVTPDCDGPECEPKPLCCPEEAAAKETAAATPAQPVAAPQKAADACCDVKPEGCCDESAKIEK